MAVDVGAMMYAAPLILSVSAIGTIGWVASTWLRVKHGYPLENSWGKPMLPAASNETMERVKLLVQENAQLRAEVGSVKDRLQVLERIAVDRGTRLAAEIDDLVGKPVD